MVYKDFEDALNRLDSKVIEAVVNSLRSDDSTPLRILDAGCADGYVTNSRFGHYQNVEILGIDKKGADIAIANANEEHKRRGFRFQKADIAQPLNGQLAGDFDIIFCALTLHHLGDDDQQRAVQNLWDNLRTPGALIVRSSDDGLKVHWPPNEELDDLIAMTNVFEGSSDRNHGRKVYTHLKELSPTPSEIKMEFQCDSTVGLSEKDRLNFFDDNHSFRANYAKRLAEQVNARPRDIEEYQRLRRILLEQRELFGKDESLFDITVQNIAYAIRNSFSPVDTA